MNYSGYSSSPSAYPNYSEQLDANVSVPSNVHGHSYTPIVGYPSQESPPKQMYNYTTVQQQQQPAAFYSQPEYGCYPNASPMPIGSVNPYGGGGSVPYYYCGGQSTVASGTSLDDEAHLDSSETSADAGKVTRQRTPRKRQRLRKDPNEPQKPVSAYALFFRDTQAAIKGQNPNASFGEVSKIVAAMWDGLDSEAKNSYKQRTELAKKDYLKQRAAYRATHLSGSCQTSDDVASISSSYSLDRYVDYVPQGMLPPSQETDIGTFGGFFADRCDPSGSI
ncbi:TOX high mobility group box family member [Trichuris trichiura]|uniref:TOX high mobility group box family member n=1 Tax=Trichuris trichiura TaxID=36087 RepID=A0A077YXK4_TRITR|nr:TOX high mobility group box family member [Trichuris trichiura]